VFGFVPTIPPLESGTFAELLAAGPEVVIAGKPAGLSFRSAVAIPLAGATALDAVDAIEVAPATPSSSSGRPAAWARSPSSSQPDAERPS
jgi:NADPH:quinone reductase-like Zn-dependent oxidoreductase